MGIFGGKRKKKSRTVEVMVHIDIVDVSIHQFSMITDVDIPAGSKIEFDLSNAKAKVLASVLTDKEEL